MNLCIKEYKHEYKDEVNKLISDDDFVRNDIISCLNRWPQHGSIVIVESEVVGVGVFTEVSKKTSMTLYVKPSKRKKGIGIALLKHLEDTMRNVGAEEIVCDFRVNDVEKTFLYKSRYNYWFKSNFMTYSGSKLAVDNDEIINYEDKYYHECQKVFSESFHKMRLSVGLDSTLSLPSEEERNHYKENAENIFLLRKSDEIVAAVRLEANEIDSLSVGVEHQHKGYGKALLRYAVNRLLDKGYTTVALWVVEGNSARFLYEKVGFIKERTHEFVVKCIK
ncbi:GNAT family N-acetyltransferase [Clostridium sp.]|uniref:GNAT family N-acetyltransferase n=1 Tax=Clostridium sp. TaxID=1506 RepID=UPI00321679B0